MQLCALDNTNHIIFANKAAKHTDYFCLECKTIVRLRGGHHRQNHFYHLDFHRKCRQNGKSMEHIQTQIYFLETLPKGECILEHPFSSIGRIADVAWMPQKIIFEIQCSPISAKEITERNRDYVSQGFRVVWILHDNRYNRTQVSSAELALVNAPHYYTNISKERTGGVYDSCRLIAKGYQRKLLGPLPIDVAQPKIFADVGMEISSRKLLLERSKGWPFYFSGDLVDQHLVGDLSLQEKLLELEQMVAALLTTGVVNRGWLEWLWDGFYLAVIRPYKLLFQILLERACK